MSIQSATNAPVLPTAQALPERDPGAALRQAQNVQTSSAAVAVDPLRAVGATRSAEAAREELDEAVDSVSRFVGNDNLEFTIDEESGRRLIRLVDRQTQEVLRQIPSEEMLQIAKALDKLQGLLVHQKA